MSTPEVVPVLARDAALAEAVPPARRAAATDASRAQVLPVARGEWDAGGDAGVAFRGQGLLVLDGLLVRRVGLTSHVGAELLGPGDLLRPAEHDGMLATLPFTATWRARRGPVRGAGPRVERAHVPALRGRGRADRRRDGAGAPAGRHAGDRHSLPRLDDRLRLS